MTTVDTRRNRLVERLLGDQHSLPLSLALHLVPGVLIVAVYLLVTEPIVAAMGYPSFLAWALAMCLGLAPVELGLLLWLGHRRNGRFSLRGVVGYLGRPLPRGKLVATVIPLIVWFLVMAVVLLPLDTAVYDALFRWLPFEGAGGDITAYLGGFPRSVMIITLAACIPLTGLLFPIIEELYFRGFLMPRLSRMGGWSPVVSAVLFSLYHLWSPWGLLSRVMYILPGAWLVWRKKDLRVTLGMHPGTTFVMQTLGVLALALNVMP